MEANVAERDRELQEAVGRALAETNLLRDGSTFAQRSPERLDIPALTLDFWTSAYQLIND